MKKLIYTSVAVSLFIGLGGCAQDGMMMKKESTGAGMVMRDGMGMKMDMKMMDMKKMDANGDGMISKNEFIKHHEMMYDMMKKNNNGMVSVKDMQMMMDEMMKK